MRSSPYAVRQTVRHCLEKDPGNRFQSARDLSFALAAMSEATSQRRCSESAGNTALAPWYLDRRLAFALIALAILTYRLVLPQPQPMNWSGALLGGPDMPSDPASRPTATCLPSMLWIEATHRSP
jgi:hypothetical protein